MDLITIAHREHKAAMSGPRIRLFVKSSFQMDKALRLISKMSSLFITNFQIGTDQSTLWNMIGRTSVTFGLNRWRHKLESSTMEPYSRTFLHSKRYTETDWQGIAQSTAEKSWFKLKGRLYVLDIECFDESRPLVKKGIISEEVAVVMNQEDVPLCFGLKLLTLLTDPYRIPGL